MQENYVKLAKGEKLLHYWIYANERVGKRLGDRALMVTNRRVISKKRLGHTYEHEEIRLSDVKNLQGKLAVSRVTGYLVTAIVFLVLALAAVATMLMLESDNPMYMAAIAAGALCGVIGLVFVLCYAFIKRTSFALHIDTRRAEGERFVVAANQQKKKAVKKVKRKKKRRETTRIWINVATARQMLEVLGSLPYEQ